MRYLALLFAASCSLDGGQSGSETPTFCADDAVGLVSDSSIPVEGFSFAADDLVATAGGSWGGALSQSGGGAVVASMAVARSLGPIQAIERVLVDPGAPGGPVLAGAAQDVANGCPPGYVVSVEISLATTDGALAELFSAGLSATTPDGGAFFAQIPLEDLVGSARPKSFDPADFDTTSLDVFAFMSGGQWLGSVDWAANRTDPATGVIIGVSENVGGLTFDPTSVP